jgi:hypothetical protein
MKDEAEVSAPMLGSAAKPEAWLVESLEGMTFCYQDYRFADFCAADFGGEIIPLYRSPSLTDAEREAICDAALELDEITGESIPETVLRRLMRQAAILRGLLERTK